MAKVTQTLKTGMTVLTGGNVPAYTLEYLSPTKKKRAGEFDTIVLPYIELGRANNCNVQYGEENTTVSRKHAAIERRGNTYFLIHFSQTNPSLINGQPIDREAQLNNGDEIQLSMEGPKLRFNTTATGTSNMGFTRKINLLIKQSTKQYKTAMYSLLGVLIIVCIVGGWFIFSQQKEIRYLTEKSAEIDRERTLDSLKHIQESEKNAKLIADLVQSNKTLQAKAKKLEDDIKRIIPEPEFENIFYNTFKDHIYFLEVVQIYVTKPTGESGVFNDLSWIGTAFLCSDGKLVTARHCIQGWRYGFDENSNFVNLCELNGGRISVRYRVTSSRDWFEFEYKDVILDDSNDMEYLLKMNYEDGTSVQLDLKFATEYKSDWAYYQTNRSSKLNYDKDLSMNLEAADKLYILGFSFGKGGPTKGVVNPLYSESSVATSGITDEGLILITNRNFEKGNSGGPVFVRMDTTIKCIGIVSNATLNPVTGETSSIGGIVPIGNIQ